MARCRPLSALLPRIAPAWCLCAILCFLATASAQQPQPPQQPQPQQLAGQQVIDVRIVGQEAVSLQKIMAQIRTRAGRAFDPLMVEEDVRRLNQTRMLLDVKTRYEVPPTGGVIVIFQVVERPVLRHVKYIGNKQIKTKKLVERTELKVGNPLDPYMIDEARQKMEALYREKGYNNTRIEIIEGNKPGDKGAVFLIHEGVAQKVWTVKFVGNTIASDARLKTQIQSKPPILWLFRGYVDREKIDGDVARLTAYYRSLGFFNARIGRELEYNEAQSWLTLTFVIDEGPRYRVRNLYTTGNEKFSTPELMQDLQLKSGDFYDQGKMNADVLSIQDVYGAKGYIFANVQADPRFLEEPGTLDLVYNVSEGERYRVGRIDVQITGENPHTRIRTVLNRLSLRPGDVVDTRQLRASERRLKASQLFNVDPSTGTSPKIVLIPPEDGLGNSFAQKPQGKVRGQSPDPPTYAPDGSRLIDVVVIEEPITPASATTDGDSLSSDDPWQQPHGPLVPPQVEFPAGAAGNLSPTTPTQAGEAPKSPSFWPEALRGIFRWQSPDDVSAGRSPNGSSAGPASGDEGSNTQLRWQPSPASPSGPRNLFASSNVPAAAYWPTGGSNESSLARRESQPVLRGQSPNPVTDPWGGYNGNTAGTPSAGYWPNGTAPTGVPPTNYVPPNNYASPPNYAAAPGYSAPPGYASPPPNYSSPAAANPYATAPGAAGTSLPPGTINAGSYPPGTMPSGAMPPAAGYPPSNAYAQPGVLPAPNPRYGDPVVQPGSPPPPSGLPPLSGLEQIPPGAPGSALQAEEQDPFVILQPTVEEARTGRIMFGIGVNSDAGVVGNAVLEEQNFDIMRPPHSWSELIEGTGFRGAGQRLRLEAVPGTQVQRYMFNFSEPYLFDTPISFGLSGFYFDRRYRDWDENRAGGQVSLGYQLTPDLSITGSLRAEDVKISDPRIPTPAELAEVVGSNSLYKGRLALAHDTRDNVFLPTEGHLIELAFEQGFGSFDFPRGTLDIRQFFLIRQRPDGSGRHVLGLSFQVGASGSDTPIFEHFFAGGTTTLRGFDFRGASPVKLGTVVGGEYQMLGSVEYLMPVTADDALRVVFFCDFGTVEERPEFNLDTFRVSPGAGLRITVPALGPAPIALDLAFPVAKEPTDDTQVFSFRIGLFR